MMPRSAPASPIPDNLSIHMQEALVSYLAALFDRCRRRWVEAARLIGANLDQWPNLTVIGPKERVDLFDLLPFWEALCHRYRTERAPPQADLFTDTPTAVEAFAAYIHWECWPTLGMDDGVVRAVLRACDVLAIGDRAAAGYYLAEHVRQMSMQPSLIARDPANHDLS